jgi:outer membrane protein assembly factor BamB
MPSTRHAALTAAALLVGCAGSFAAGFAPAPGLDRIPALPASADRGWLARDANRHDPWLYVDSEQNAEVLMYDLAKPGIPQVGEITTGLSSPAGMTIDAKGTLYVSNSDGANVAVYPAGATKPRSTLSQGIVIPNGLAVDTNGDLYVANKSSYQGGAASNILVYHAGQTSPFRTIASSLIQNPGELFFDWGRNLYIADSTTGISEIPFGSLQPVSLGLQGLSSWTGSVAVDPLDGNLYAAGMHDNRESVLAFAPGSAKSMRRLKTGAFADYLCFGTVSGTEYLFVPDSAGNTVSLFKHNVDTPATVLKTVQYARDAIVKPANVQ